MNNKIKNEIITLTEKLISFRSSEIYPSQKKACLDFIESYFKSTSAIIKKIINKNCTAILISNTKSNIADLLLNGHIDVVEGENRLYKAQKIGDKLYGRGAIDMKGSVAVMMLLMKQLLRKNSNKKITLMIVGDEEIPGPKSTPFLIKKFKLRPTFTIVGEETGFDFVVQQKGSLNLKIKATGKAAHSAFPEKGINAIEKCIDWYQSLSKVCKPVLAYLRGGQAINSIPDFCEMGINIRYMAKTDLRKILNFVAKRRRVDFSINAYYSNVIMESVGCEKEIRRIREIAKIIGNIKIRTKQTATGSDAKYFSEQRLPVIVFGPKGAGYHEDGEYVEIDSLVTYYKILYEFIKK